MKKLILISILLVLADASFMDSIADGLIVDGIWDCGGRFTLYHMESYDRIDKHSFLCPQSYSKGFVYGTVTTQALCFDDVNIDIHDWRLRYTLNDPNNYEFTIIRDENKIEWDLYHFLLGWANVFDKYEDYDQFVSGLSKRDQATPCFITELKAESGENQYTTSYFEVDQPNFTFYQQDFTFRGITYNKMYCNERTKLEAEPKIFNKPIVQTNAESHDEYQNVWILLIILSMASVVILPIIMLSSCWCCGDQKKNDTLTKEIESETTTTFQSSCWCCGDQKKNDTLTKNIESEATTTYQV